MGRDGDVDSSEFFYDFRNWLHLVGDIPGCVKDSKKDFGLETLDALDGWLGRAP